MTNSERDLHDRFLRLFLEHEESLRVFVSSLLFDEDEEREVMQDVAVVLWRKFDDEMDSLAFRRWAFGVARMEVLSFRRDRARDRHCFGDEVFDVLAESISDRADSFEAERRALDHCLKKLPAEQRELVEKAYAPGVRIDHLAEQLGRTAMALNGPAMPVSELAALYRISGGQTSLFRTEAQRLHGIGRMLNMTWVTPGATWQRSLWIYRTTGEEKWLRDAVEKADRYIAERIETQPTDFAEAGDGTFFEYLTPWWKDLYELYLDTGEPRHLNAAHAGARRYAQFVWFYPAVPEGEITVNTSGFAPRRGRPDEDGLLEVAKETVPNWQVSDQGLVCEGNGTAARLGILLATHAPFFLRIAEETGDDFLRDIARSAVIGRYANFPGYHLNTRFSTAQEKTDFPLHDYEHLKPTTSMHFNHILPHTNLIIDYLVSRCYELSDGQIDFPAEYAEGYAYLQGRIYGAEYGSFYDHENVRPWMPAGVLEVSDDDVNFVSGRSEKGFYIALMNTCGRELHKVEVQLSADRFEALPELAEAKVWMANEPLRKGAPVRNGRFRVSLDPKGITAIHVPGLRPRVQFQNNFGQAPEFALVNEGEFPVAGCKVEASVLTFGPELRWIHAWLRSDRGKPAVKGLKLSLTLDDGTTVEQTDDSFPFEFHVALPPSAKQAKFALTPLAK